MKKVNSAEAYVSQAIKKQFLIKLRELLLATDLNETIKWNTPVYTLNDKYRK